MIRFQMKCRITCLTIKRRNNPLLFNLCHKYVRKTVSFYRNSDVRCANMSSVASSTNEYSSLTTPLNIQADLASNVPVQPGLHHQQFQGQPPPQQQFQQPPPQQNQINHGGHHGGHGQKKVLHKDVTQEKE